MPAKYDKRQRPLRQALPPRRKKSVQRRSSEPVGVLIAVLRGPDRRYGNVRLIIEGPFVNAVSAISALRTLLKSATYSVADSQVLTVSSAKRFYDIVARLTSIVRTS